MNETLAIDDQTEIDARETSSHRPDALMAVIEDARCIRVKINELCSMADLKGVERQRIYRWANGVGVPGLYAYEKLVAALRAALDEEKRRLVRYLMTTMAGDEDAV